MTNRRDLVGGLIAAAAAARIGPVPALAATRGAPGLMTLSYRPLNLEAPVAALRDAFTPNDGCFVRYHLAVVPSVDVRDWRLEVGGASAVRPRRFTLDELRRSFETITVAAVNQCSGYRRALFTPRVPGVQWGSGAVANARWTGVRLRDVLRHVGVRDDALELVIDGADGPAIAQTPDFVKSLPIAKALEAEPIVAFQMNGQPLPHHHGAPARLIVPGWTATYWMKHLTGLTIESARFDGFWMKTAYRVPTGKFPITRYPSQENADTTPVTDILVNSLITRPLEGDRIRHGETLRVEGWAWDGGSGIDRVEVSLDEGATWQGAKLGEDLGRFAWRAFELRDVRPPRGRLSVAARATSRAGATQPAQLTPNASGYYHNTPVRITVDVA